MDRQDSYNDLFGEKVRSKSFREVKLQSTRIGTQLMGLLMEARRHGDMNIVHAYRRRLSRVYEALGRYHENMIRLNTAMTFDDNRRFPVREYAGVAA